MSTRSRAHRLPRSAPRRAHLRSGFTLVELMVSVLVLSVGLLALSGATAVIARQVSGGAQMALAASVAESRFEALRAQRCEHRRGGSAESRGITETWTVTPSATGTAVTDTIAFAVHGTRRVHGFTSLLPCPPPAP